MTTFKDVLETAYKDLSILPEGVSTNYLEKEEKYSTKRGTILLDNTVKLIVSTLDCALFYNIITAPAGKQIAEGIKSQFKPLNDFTKTVGVFSTFKNIQTQDFWNVSKVSLGKNLSNAFVSGLDFLSGLQTFDLVQLGTISNAMGSIPGWQLVVETVAFSTVRDVVGLSGVVLSLYSNVKAISKEDKSEKIISLRIAIVGDLAKCAILSLSLVLNCTSLKVVKIAYIAVDLKNLTKPIVWCVAASGFYKAARDARLNPL